MWYRSWSTISINLPTVSLIEIQYNIIKINRPFRKETWQIFCSWILLTIKYFRDSVAFLIKKKSSFRFSHSTDQVWGWRSFRECRARRIHSSTSVPWHVYTQQGRVNAQQGCCPLNLKGFLNVSVSKSLDRSRWSDHYFRRVIAALSPRSKVTHRDSFVNKLEPIPRTLINTMPNRKEIAKWTLVLLSCTNITIKRRKGFLTFPVKSSHVRDNRTEANFLLSIAASIQPNLSRITIKSLKFLVILLTEDESCASCASEWKIHPFLFTLYWKYDNRKITI
jgi:hypothetical protein